jgi:hypothetical protein
MKHEFELAEYDVVLCELATNFLGAVALEFKGTLVSLKTPPYLRYIEETLKLARLLKPHQKQLFYTLFTRG